MQVNGSNCTFTASFPSTLATSSCDSSKTPECSTIFSKLLRRGILKKRKAVVLSNVPLEAEVGWHACCSSFVNVAPQSESTRWNNTNLRESESPTGHADAAMSSLELAYTKKKRQCTSSSFKREMVSLDVVPKRFNVSSSTMFPTSHQTLVGHIIPRVDEEVEHIHNHVSKHFNLQHNRHHTQQRNGIILVESTNNNTTEEVYIQIFFNSLHRVSSAVSKLFTMYITVDENNRSSSQQRGEVLVGRVSALFHKITSQWTLNDTMTQWMSKTVLDKKSVSEENFASLIEAAATVVAFAQVCDFILENAQVVRKNIDWSPNKWQSWPSALTFSLHATWNMILKTNFLPCVPESISVVLREACFKNGSLRLTA